ncbi:hypothetical protein AcW1_009177 [Taiwanofungus camphoratus]|nr:hypothetical protein AcW1_009177 [Antrodia cinnamomea]KAI0958556.1 hypothetical protein AcV7_004347 [Antrodia cinnamomea]
MLPHLSLVLFLLMYYGVEAGSVGHGGNCSIGNQRLQLGTYQFQTDCDSMTYCTESGYCERRGCRRDDFPFGYPEGADLPPKCGPGYFCPDEEDQCLPMLAVGSPCQFNRDDQCEGPPNYKELADRNGHGLNVNGSVCLNNVCMWANATLGKPCEIQNTAYVAFGSGNDFPDIVSRGNCRAGLYCDSQQLMCMQTKDIGTACDADKKCSTYNCLASGVCGARTDTPHHVAPWVYAIVGIGIMAGVIATLVGMFFMHKKERDAERDKRVQYWQEQNALRQNIMKMQETARNSLPYVASGGIGSTGSTLFGRETTTPEDHVPMLQATSKSSGLRYHVSDDGLHGSDESFVTHRISEKRDFGKF